MSGKNLNPFFLYCQRGNKILAFKNKSDWPIVTDNNEYKRELFLAKYLVFYLFPFFYFLEFCLWQLSYFRWMRFLPPAYLAHGGILCGTTSSISNIMKKKWRQPCIVQIYMFVRTWHQEFWIKVLRFTSMARRTYSILKIKYIWLIKFQFIIFERM